MDRGTPTQIWGVPALTGVNQNPEVGGAYLPDLLEGCKTPQCDEGLNGDPAELWLGAWRAYKACGAAVSMLAGQSGSDKGQGLGLTARTKRRQPR